jgi:putative molybdopterin biosynthesis protein
MTVRSEEAILFELLAGITRDGSIATAARNAGVSYRKAWGLLRRWEQRFGQPLAQMQRGRGSSLTSFGAQLLRVDQEAGEDLKPALDAASARMARLLEQTAKRNRSRVSIHASHDLALARLRDLVREKNGLDLDLKFMGSLDSVRSLARSECDLAGFHVSAQLDEAARAVFLGWLKPRWFKLIRLVTREQGLMVERGNPRKITGLKTLTRRGVKFVNRQVGSGTRLQFDQLLAQASIDQSAIKGYQTEEFTHLAVAATIAGGMANVGFGIKAAAAQYGLGFIPLVVERYFLACRADNLERAALEQLLRVLRGPEFERIVSSLAGYQATATGEIVDVRSVLE